MVTLFPFIRLILLKLRKRHVSYRNPTTMQRDVDTYASLDEGVRRARNTKCYSPRVEDESPDPMSEDRGLHL